MPGPQRPASPLQGGVWIRALAIRASGKFYGDAAPAFICIPPIPHKRILHGAPPIGIKMCIAMGRRAGAVRDITSTPRSGDKQSVRALPCAFMGFHYRHHRGKKKHGLGSPGPTRNSPGPLVFPIGTAHWGTRATKADSAVAAYAALTCTSAHIRSGTGSQAARSLGFPGSLWQCVLHEGCTCAWSSCTIWRVIPSAEFNSLVKHCEIAQR